MPEPTVGFSIARPISVWNKPLDADFRQMFRALSKVAVLGFSAQWDRAALGASEALQAVGLKDDPPRLAWLLIRRALTHAIFALTREVVPRFTAEDEDFERLSEEIEPTLGDVEIVVNQDFFEHPRQLPILDALREPFRDWLIGAGLSEAEACSVSSRLDGYFVAELHHEWRRDPSEYQTILDAINSPFAEATERERQWMEYGAWLERQLDEPMFDEAFSIRQVYVPLRATWDEKVKGEPDGDQQFSDRHRTREPEKVVRHVVDLMDDMVAWVEAVDRHDPIRVLSGGPGSGKSTFCRFFAAKVFQRGVRVVLVPLHRFDPRDDLAVALRDFARHDELLPDDLLVPGSTERLLVLLDGLDELALQGRTAQDVARRFVQEIDRTVNRQNLRELRLQVVLSGRELAIQTHQAGLRRTTQILTLVGYAPLDVSVFGSKALAQTDQRDIWWRQYGVATARELASLPSELCGDDLREITDQPLLNYLLALSFTRNMLDFSAEQSLNAIYADLIVAVYERGWGKPAGHAATHGLSEEQFVRILEEIALATWHGDGRTATLQTIAKRCESARLSRYLDRFEEGAEAGITRLLTAFYFRQSGRNYEGNRTFEFTHKSFGEYLAAGRLVRLLDGVDQDLDAANEHPDRGIDIDDALRRWADVCGPTALDQYRTSFLRAEVALRGEDTCRCWQATLTGLVNRCLRVGFPMETLGLASYFQMSRQARNAEEALLVALAACSWVTREVSRVDWPTATSAGTWLRVLQGQREGGGNVVVLESLSYLDLSTQTLEFLDFFGAVLVGSRICQAKAAGAIFQYADLRGADLSGADLRDANLDGARLDGSKFRDCDLLNGSLLTAILQKADFRDTDLRGADLRGADLRHADLRGVQLASADMSSATLEGVNFGEVQIDKATAFHHTRGIPRRAPDLVMQQIRSHRSSRRLLDELADPP